MAYPTLATDRQLAVAVEAVGRQCAVMRNIHARTGMPPLRDFSADFAGLARIVTGQQLSAASAAAIWSRVANAVMPFDARALHAMQDKTLAALGLSSAKIRTLKAVAAAVTTEELSFEDLNRASDEEIIARLTALHGIGPWTADIYLLFALRRADAFPAGDLALAIAVERLFRLKARPSPTALLTIAERWRPYRGAAARLLWADYALVRNTPPAKSRRPAR